MSTLQSPIQLGAVSLGHRVVMAPLTRSRSEQPGDVPGALMLEYYGQRASRGGLVVSEGTAVSATARGWFGAPGIYTEAQIAGWKRIVDAVHERGGVMFSQLWHTGRSSHVDVSGATPASASVTPGYWQDPTHLTSTPAGWVQPSPHVALDAAGIQRIVEEYRQAARNAKAAGFDGVELHGANGYLVDQFLQDGSNRRTDEYGGSIENRARLLFEIVEAMVSVWGKDRVGVRIGPGGTWNGMSDRDPDALFGYVATKLGELGIAYLHVIEPRVKGNVVVAEGQGPIASRRLRTLFGGPVIAAGGFEPATAKEAIESGDADLVAFGRHFVSNPDLPRRIAEGLPLAPHDRDTFYTFERRGYADYPAYEAVTAAAS